MQRLARMDGLRGVLAVYVMLGHALPLAALPDWVQAPFSHGEAAVDLFFALSGLVIAQSLARFQGRFAPFMAARARRLLPVYFVALAFGIGVTALGDPLAAAPWAGQAARDIFAPALPPNLLAHVVAHLTLTQGIIPQAWLPYAYVTLLGPAWSLSTEGQFYALIGWAGPRALPRLALALLLAALVWHMLGLGTYFSRAALPDAAAYFALGIASALLLRGEDTALFGGCLAGACAVAGAGKAIIPLLWAVAMLALARPWGRVLEHRALLALGAISYPLYLINEPVERLAALAVGAGHGPVLFTLLYLPLALGGALAAALLLHRLVEEPFLRPGKALVFRGIARAASR
jgi:peptidoglycan/LPS O-acetylase OafA/YrhL